MLSGSTGETFSGSLHCGELDAGRVRRRWRCERNHELDDGFLGTNGICAPVVGIGDEKLDMFSDPRFLALGIKYVRYDMSWDALSVAWQRPRYGLDERRQGARL